MNRLVWIALVVAACKGGKDDCSTPAPAPAVTAGTQADLASELDAADRNGTWMEVKHRWQGKQGTWTVIRHRALCRTAEACNVAPFPVRGGAKYGWLPKLELAPEQFAKLDAGCGAAEDCQITFDGVLATLDVSGDEPTKLRFTDVK